MKAFKIFGLIGALLAICALLFVVTMPRIPADRMRDMIAVIGIQTNCDAVSVEEIAPFVTILSPADNGRYGGEKGILLAIYMPSPFQADPSYITHPDKWIGYAKLFTKYFQLMDEGGGSNSEIQNGYGVGYRIHLRCDYPISYQYRPTREIYWVVWEFTHLDRLDSENPYLR